MNAPRPLDAQRRIADICERFDRAWSRGHNPRIEDFLAADGPAEERRELLKALLEVEFHYRRQFSPSLHLDEYLRRFPDQADAVRAAFPGQATDIDAASPLRTPSTAQPAFLGRYHIEAELGGGTYGVVYRGYDDTLSRAVAIKVPRPEIVEQLGGIDSYLREARVLAGLDHPHIVPVHDVGHTDDGLCYVVYGFVEGSDLKTCLAQRRYTPTEAARVVAALAEALQHAHQKGIYHRDVKPANILVDGRGKVYLADFGLALRHEDYGKGPTFAGTLAYMSPEQVRRESHRVDGRADIFSLSAVFYELLTGQWAFQGTAEQVRDRIARGDVRPPRQLDSGIPGELERVCLKALARLVSDRYTTAADMADDLRAWLAAPAPDNRSAAPAVPTGPVDVAAASTASVSIEPPPVRVVPKGLRSFDAGDADFFLELLPGPRDRSGLPDSLRFWKARIEPTDPERAFAVGLMYGPSGCGKSSLVKAGLLPRLAGHVTAIYVEATPGDTEARLRRGLHKHCPGLGEGLGLVDCIAALRSGRGLAPGQKVLLVLDQFEQWLHGRGTRSDDELVQALRQCDGGRVQALVMVRDDFWMAVTRFMHELEVRLLEGQNSAAVDLFDMDHAGKVLATFGRAFGKLPDDVAAVTKEQHEFLSQAVAALAGDGKVICVRLALFAEMMKGRPWTPGTLREVGGVEGVGASFLEETFSAPGAPPEHRYHQNAARLVLNALLPEADSDIKGAVRSRGELQDAAGYAARPKEFAELLRILDGEVRLITPTDEVAQGVPPPGLKYYQLTHDYLVPSLREWLTRKQKETRRGRAELLLADRAAVWSARPEKRLLPSLLQWITIRLLTRKKNWTQPQRRLMRKAGRYFMLRGLALAVILLLLLGAGWEINGRLRARALMDSLMEARTEEVPTIIRQMAPYRRWVNGPLHTAYWLAEDDRKKLHAALASLPAEYGMGYVAGRMLHAEPQELLVIREQLAPYAEKFTTGYWAVLEDTASAQSDPGERLRAACALAAYAPDDERWEKVSGYVARRLVEENALVLSQWAGALKPVSRHLLPQLAILLLQEKRSAEWRRTVISVYANYAEGVPNAFSPLEAVLAEESGPNAGAEDRLALARRQANAAAALAALGRWEKVTTLLRHTADPTLRSFLIDRLAGNVKVRQVRDRLGSLQYRNTKEVGGKQDPDVSVPPALLLALGEFDANQLPSAEREGLSAWLLEVYREDTDGGIHGAAGWLLRQWGQQEEVEKIDRDCATGKVFVRGGAVRIREGEKPTFLPGPPGRWYVNRQRQTFTIVPPGEFEMEEMGKQVAVRVDYRFAIAAREVTIAEFQRFREGHPQEEKRDPRLEFPATEVTWYAAAEYCNWLSDQDKIPKDQWCYLPNEQGKYADGMKVKANSLSLLGYRLPTEAEWELACRAGSKTRWSFGDAEDLLPKYACFVNNSSSRLRPVGSLKPNDLGLFDMHGNAAEWCHNRFDDFREKDKQKDDPVKQDGSRPWRGGAFNDNPQVVGSSFRGGKMPTYFSLSTGFRPARTMPEVSR